VCEHEPTHHEAMQWLENGATAHEPPCVHCATSTGSSYPRFAPGSERAAELRRRLWRAPARACVAIAAALIGANDGPGGVKRPKTEEPEPEEAARKRQREFEEEGEGEGERRRQRTIWEATLQRMLEFDFPPDILTELLFRLDARELSALFDVNRAMRDAVAQRLAALPGARLCPVMLHAARDGRHALLAVLRNHKEFGTFAPAALQAAAETGRVRVVRFLLEDGRADLEDNGEMRPLLSAVWHRHTRTVEALRTHQLRTLSRAWAPINAHLMAALHNNWETLEVLLRMQAFELEGLQRTAKEKPVLNNLLVTAAEHGFVEMTEKLAAITAVPEQKGDLQIVSTAAADVLGRKALALPRALSSYPSSPAFEVLLRRLNNEEKSDLADELVHVVGAREHVQLMLLLESLTDNDVGQFDEDLMEAVEGIATDKPHLHVDESVVVALLASSGHINKHLEQHFQSNPFQFSQASRRIVREWLEHVRTQARPP